MVLEFLPGARLADYGFHPGDEFGYVLEGTLSLELEGAEPRFLNEGDSAHYRSDRPHLFRNADEDRPLRLLCVNSPPNF
jgi:quercetin dioxygenase-like cupin family protein